MGLISVVKDVVGAGLDSLSGSFQSAVWKEYIVSGDMSGGILMKRGEKILTDKGRNRKADNNLISSGTGIDVQDGQCMIIVDNGQIVEFCTEPGRYTYDSSTQPSLLCGENKGLKAFGKEILNQWSAGGQRFSTQRVYFINMCELADSPIRWGLGDLAFHHTTIMKNGAPPIELDITLKGNGQVTMRIADPLKFYQNIGAQKVGGDNDGLITIADDDEGTGNHGILSNLKSGIRDKLGEAIATLGYENAIPYTAIRAYSTQVATYINKLLSEEWAGKRGFEVVTFSINGSFTPTEEDKDQLQEMQRSFTMGANTNAAIYDVQKGWVNTFGKAAENGGAGSMMGLGIAGGTMGGMMGAMGQMTHQPQQPWQPQQPVAPAANTWTCACGKTNDGAFCSTCGTKKPEPKPAGGWTCSCGRVNDGMFCGGCGTKKPEAPATWTCTCGRVNDGIFCGACGTKKPEAKKGLKCDKCGWTSADATSLKFCPNCGDPVSEADFV